MFWIKLQWKMARSVGFEPTTAWFVARYSIQLSYERVKAVNSNYFGVNCNPARVLACGYIVLKEIVARC